MTESVVVVQNTTPVVQITNPSQGVVEVLRSEFGVEVTNVCDVVVVGDTPTSVEVGGTESIETTVVNVVVEVADTGVSVVSVGEQGPSSEDLVKYQEVSDVEVTGNGPNEITTIWKGEALPGVLHTAAQWRIRKITVETGRDGDATIHWANGSAAFDKVWEAVPDDEFYKTYDFDPND
jgi:hypothetical protein